MQFSRLRQYLLYDLSPQSVVTNMNCMKSQKIRERLLFPDLICIVYMYHSIQSMQCLILFSRTQIWNKKLLLQKYEVIF